MSVDLIALSSNWLKYVYYSSSSTGAMTAYYSGVTLSSGGGSTLRYIGYDSHQGYYFAAAKIRGTKTLTSSNPLANSIFDDSGYYSLIGELTVTQYNYSSNSSTSGHSTVAWKVSTTLPSTVQTNGYNSLATLTNVIYSGSLYISGFGTNNSSYPGYLTFATPPLDRTKDYYIYFYTTDSTMLNCSFSNRLYAAPVEQISGSTNLLSMDSSDITLTYVSGTGATYQNTSNFSNYSSYNQIDLTIPGSANSTSISSTNVTAQSNFYNNCLQKSSLGQENGYVTVGGRGYFSFSVNNKKYKIIGWKADSDSTWATETEASYATTRTFSDYSIEGFLYMDSDGREFRVGLKLNSNCYIYTNENWQIATPYVYKDGEWTAVYSNIYKNSAWTT